MRPVKDIPIIYHDFYLSFDAMKSQKRFYDHDCYSKGSGCLDSSRGFTLIELLVVIAIISLLVSILLPSLKKAKDMAFSILCCSNLHSIGTGLHLYSSDFNGWLPCWNYGTYPDSRSWVQNIMPYVGMHGSLWCCPASPDAKSDYYTMLDQCDDPFDPNFVSIIVYTMNIGINGVAFYNSSRDYISINNVCRPSMLIYAADATGRNSNYYNPRNTNGWLYTNGSVFPELSGAGASPSFYSRHFGKINILFVGGNVEPCEEGIVQQWGEDAFTPNTDGWQRLQLN